MTGGDGAGQGIETGTGQSDDEPDGRTGGPDNSMGVEVSPEKLPTVEKMVTDKDAKRKVKAFRKDMSRRLEDVRVIDNRKESPQEIAEYKGRIGKLMLLERKWGELQWKGRYVSDNEGKAVWDPEMVIVIKNEKGRFSKFKPIVLQVIEHSLELGMPLDMALGNACVKRDDYEAWLAQDIEAGPPCFRGLKARMQNAWSRGVTRWYSLLLEKGSKSPDTIMKIISLLDDRLFSTKKADGLGLGESLSVVFKDAPERKDKEDLGDGTGGRRMLVGPDTVESRTAATSPPGVAGPAPETPKASVVDPLDVEEGDDEQEKV